MFVRVTQFALQGNLLTYLRGKVTVTRFILSTKLLYTGPN